jgi:hypothetical protein
LAWQYLIEITRRDAPRWVQAIRTTRPAGNPPSATAPRHNRNDRRAKGGWASELGGVEHIDAALLKGSRRFSTSKLILTAINCTPNNDGLSRFMGVHQ